jgi:hypothetical protein
VDWAWTMGALFIITKANTTINEIVPKIAWFINSSIQLYYLLNASQEALIK